MGRTNWVLFLVSLCLPAAFSPAGAEDIHFIWAKATGGTLHDFGYAIAVDATGSVYATGSFAGTADFDPGPGTYNLVSSGSADIFVAKLDGSGNLVWARAMGGTAYDEAYGIAVDPAGNVYTTGNFRGTADFDPSPVTFNLDSNGSDDIFISKLDSSGNLVWAKSIGDAEYDFSSSIALDATGNVYTTGFFAGTVDFDPGSEIHELTSSGNDDIFVSKLDSNGNYLWARAMGGLLSESGNGIAVDPAGNVYTAGTFMGTADFDPSPVFHELTSNGYDDIFISKLDGNGDYLWARSLGGPQTDWGNALTVDAAGNVYTTGSFMETADFNPGPGTFNLSSNGGYDVFISKLDSNGSLVWAKAMGGTQSDSGNAIAVDSGGNVYTTGYFSGAADFDPDTGIFNLTSTGDRDIFLNALDSGGGLAWTGSMGGTLLDVGSGIAVNTEGYVYTAGSFNGTADFYPGSRTFNLTSNGGRDIFISKVAEGYPWPMFLPATTNAGQ